MPGSREHDGRDGDRGDRDPDRWCQPPRPTPKDVVMMLAEGGEDVLRIRDGLAVRWLGFAHGEVGARHPDVEVLVGWPEPPERLLEHLGQALGDLDRPG